MINVVDGDASVHKIFSKVDEDYLCRTGLEKLFNHDTQSSPQPLPEWADM